MDISQLLLTGTARSIGAAIASGELTSQDATGWYLDRISRFQHEFGDRWTADPAATKADRIETNNLVALRHHREMRHIASDRRVSRNHHPITDPAELMHRRSATQKTVFAHGDVSCEQSGIGEDHIVRDGAVMRNMA